jgi:hypothetical protein
LYGGKTGEAAGKRLDAVMVGACGGNARGLRREEARSWLLGESTCHEHASLTEGATIS